MELKKLFMFGAVAATVLSACGEKDVFDPNYEVEKAKGDYATNFVKKFGAVNPNQNWDFATGDWTYVMSTRETPDVPTTPITITKGKELTIKADFRKGLTQKFPEYKCQVENLEKNAEGYTLVSNGPFDIYPIYHGQCNEWTLMVNGQEIAKFADINKELQFNGGTNVMPVKELQDLTTQGWRIDAPKGTSLYIQLKCTSGNDNYMKKGDIVSSVNFKINGYDADKGVSFTNHYTKDEKGNKTGQPHDHLNLKQGSLAIKKDSELLDGLEKINPFSQILLFEDAFQKLTDLDYNDFMLGIVGRDVPPVPVPVIDDKVYKDETLSKRYMIEDLGSTDDFDFNDIVVDLTGHIYVNYVEKRYEDGTVIETIHEQGSPSYGGLDVHVVHKGGIYPFQLTIGGKALDKMAGNIDANGYIRPQEGDNFFEKFIEIKDITSFDEADRVLKNNDIKIKVFKGDTTTEDGEHSWDISFPNPGDIPMIIATDPTVKFMNERVAFPVAEWVNQTK